MKSLSLATIAIFVTRPIAKKYLRTNIEKTNYDRVIGKRGPITEQLQKRYFDVAYGKVPEYEDWITRF